MPVFAVHTPGGQHRLVYNLQFPRVHDHFAFARADLDPEVEHQVAPAAARGRAVVPVLGTHDFEGVRGEG